MAIGTAVAYTIGELRFEQQEIVGGSLSILAVAGLETMAVGLHYHGKADRMLADAAPAHPAG